ncbi:MAG: hypothetical protein K2L89_06925, partial [Muribaculaceae bacterium]|nr:hypothetical protein [Muribaculaceae bacterium]
YKGVYYGFSLKLYYYPSTGQVPSLYYAPQATGKYSKIQGDWWISSDRIYINGKTADGVRTEISAESYDYGDIFSGSMIRGKHSGSCTIFM